MLVTETNEISPIQHTQHTATAHAPVMNMSWFQPIRFSPAKKCPERLKKFSFQMLITYGHCACTSHEHVVTATHKIFPYQKVPNAVKEVFTAKNDWDDNTYPITEDVPGFILGEIYEVHRPACPTGEKCLPRCLLNLIEGSKTPKISPFHLKMTSVKL